MLRAANKSLKQENLQLAVFTAFNILANYKFPLIEALVVRTRSCNLFSRLVLNTSFCAWFNSLVWQWKCLSIFTSLLPNPVFALRSLMVSIALVFKAQSSCLGVHCGSVYWFFLPSLKHGNLL